MEWLFWILPFISIIPTVLTIIHIIKTNRDRSWIWIVVFLSTAGIIAYFFVEILPSLLSTQRGRQIKQSFVSAITAQAKISKLKKQLKVSDTFEKQLALGDAYFDSGRYEEAIPVYRQCLAGLFRDSFEVQLNLAKSYFQTGQYKEADEVIRTMTKPPGDIKKSVVKLLHAQVLDKLDSHKKAEKLYSEAAIEYHGFEGSYRYGVFLKKSGKNDAAKSQFAHILDTFPTLPAFSRRTERTWKVLAKRELRSLPA